LGGRIKKYGEATSPFGGCIKKIRESYVPIGGCIKKIRERYISIGACATNPEHGLCVGEQRANFVYRKPLKAEDLFGFKIDSG